MDAPRANAAADIPSVDRLLHSAALAPTITQYGRTQVTRELRAHLEELRQAALAGTLDSATLSESVIALALGARLELASRPHLRAVFNLTGTVLHTNLGRAVLPDEAAQAVLQALREPVNLEYDLKSGRRGERDSIVEKLLCELTGAEAATVVNNNAAAVLLMLTALANRREVIVSRGELIEIGGSFRIPDIMRQAGAKLVEVGTTNRTHVADYSDAIGPRSGLLMKVHTSNYAISGFTNSVSVVELAALGRARSVPVAADLGSGSLVDLARWNLPKETTVQETIAAGADLVSFSGDKLLGGPQAGLIVGRSELIGRIRKHPLKRALRVGKLTLAALEPVLALYRSPEFLQQRLTTLRLLTRPATDMQQQAVRLQPIVQRAVGESYEVSAAPMTSQIGSGALPIDTLPSHGLVIRVIKGSSGGIERLERRLRELPRPVIGRVAGKALWLDLRCLEVDAEAAYRAMGWVAVVIIGTAGHIDHGKTTLVRALTGIDTDRLKEEKARGISIELGFAYVPLENGDVLGFVDVPGHERLVHTMAAGACGIDFALLVVAGDDGVMPQTREHVAILELFGLTRGVVAITKVDRVEATRVAEVEAEVAALLAPTGLAGSPLFPVNALAAGDPGTAALLRHLMGAATGSLEGVVAGSMQGVGGSTLQGVATGPPEGTATSSLQAVTNGSLGSGTSVHERRAGGDNLFRLAVDRVFTLAGHGTVVAGTVFSGCVRTGDTVHLFPSNLPARVRSIHAQSRPADVGIAGQRCALNLTGVDKSAISRGNWLADPRALAPTTRIDVQMQLLSGSKAPLKAWAPVYFHHGAAHLTAHAVPLDAAVISAGEKGRCQIVFATPICAVPGDRFVLRDAQALHTIGGGLVLDPFAPSRKRRSDGRLRYLRALERMVASEGLGDLLNNAPYGIRRSELMRLTGQTPGRILLPADAVTIEAARDTYILSSTAWHELRERTTTSLRKFHAEFPGEAGPDISRLRRIALPEVPDELWRALITELAAERVILRGGSGLYLPGHVVTLSEGEKTLADKLQPLIAAGRFNPPWVRDLAGKVAAPEESVRQVLRKQVTHGAVYQVVPDLFYDPRSIDELATAVTTVALEHGGTVEAAQYRDAVGLGRKRAIQILEFFDRAGHTRRMRDSRVLRPDSGWRHA